MLNSHRPRLCLSIVELEVIITILEVSHITYSYHGLCSQVRQNICGRLYSVYCLVLMCLISLNQSLISHCPGGPRPYGVLSTGYQPIYPTPSYSFSHPPPGIFPANINSMHVSLSGPNDGLSLTIETSSQPNTGPRPEDYQGPSWHSAEEQNHVKKQKRHHQQSRTIFRCVSSNYVRLTGNLGL